MVVNQGGGTSPTVNTKKPIAAKPIAAKPTLSKNIVTKKPIAKTPQLKIDQTKKEQQGQPAPKTPLPPATKKKVDYDLAGRSSWWAKLITSIPKSAYPTKRVGKILGIVFLIVVIIGVWQFVSVIGLMSGNLDKSASIGIPMTFLEFKLNDVDVNPIKPVGLIVDILIYIFLSYLIEIIINLILNMRILKSEEEKAMIPKLYKSPKKANSIAEGIANKVFKGNASQIPPKKPNNIDKSIAEKITEKTFKDSKKVPLAQKPNIATGQNIIPPKK